MNSLGRVYLNEDVCVNKRTCVYNADVDNPPGRQSREKYSSGVSGIRARYSGQFQDIRGIPSYPCAFPGLPAYVLRKQTGRLTSRKNNKNASPH